MAFLMYWIHEKDHTDPFTQGYIGVTSNLLKRIASHKKYNDNPILSNKIHKSLVTIIETELTQEEAFKKEEYYRPLENIGWNINKGGFMPPSRKGVKLNDAKQLLLGEKRTEKQKQASLEHSNRMKQKADEYSLAKRLPNHKGRKRSDVSKENYKKAAAVRPLLFCPHCNTSGKGPAMRKWHFDKCRQKV